MSKGVIKTKRAILRLLEFQAIWGTVQDQGILPCLCLGFAPVDQLSFNILAQQASGPLTLSHKTAKRASL